ncbi:hypothetical protein SPAN111604_10565 [Sphingomonas antarctica]|uniref:hypothetical protein n=1 Tax=Sphingomonas antarctica TaxID=2040274 RepID=UPI0039E77625
MAKTHDEPSNVDADNGVVIVDGPAGTVISLTPRAALTTAERLRQAGIKGEEQLAQASDDAVTERPSTD